jgi:hypothetical protein
VHGITALFCCRQYFGSQKSYFHNLDLVARPCDHSNVRPQVADGGTDYSYGATGIATTDTAIAASSNVQHLVQCK